jgi:hypothetical protein
MVAARLATLPHGGDRRPTASKVPTGILPQDAEKQGLSLHEAAERLKVSRNSVQRARNVLEQGPPKMIAAVDQGELTVRRAADTIAPRPSTSMQQSLD